MKPKKIKINKLRKILREYNSYLFDQLSETEIERVVEDSITACKKVFDKKGIKFIDLEY